MAQRYLDSTTLYGKQPNEVWSKYKGYYYIHLHQENIGRMGNHSALTDSQMAKIFNDYKYDKDASLSQTLTNQYMQLINNSIKTTSENVDLLNEVFDVSNNNASQILDRLHAALKQGFEEQFTPNKIIQMLTLESNINWSTSDKKNKNAEEARALADILSNNGNINSSNEKGLKFLDDILTDMEKTVKLLNSNQGDSLAVLIESAKNKYPQNISKMGAELSSSLDSFIKNNQKRKTLNIKDALEVAGYLQNVSEAMRTLQTKAGKPLGLQSLQGLVQKNFYSMMAEVLATHINQAASDAAVQYIVKGVKDINRSGDKSTRIEYTDAKGNYITDTSVFYDTGEKQGKADSIFNNVKVDLSVLSNAMSGSITMKVGMSNKAYVTNHFGEGSLKKFSVYSLGGGMTLGNAFSLLLGAGENVYHKYIGYNILGYGDALPNALNALQDALLTRSIIYLAAGRGKDDFAQFMLLNGELLSVWDIIKFALNNDIGLSSSQQGSDKKGIYLSITNRKDIMQYAKSRFWGRRIVKTNESIMRGAIHAKIVPSKIIDYVSKNS